MSIQAIPTVAEPLENIAISEPAPNPLQSLFDTVLEASSRDGLKQFLRQARETRLDLNEMKRYLSCLEKGHLISSKEKNKQLFLHACHLPAEDEARKILQEANIDVREWLVDFLSLESIPPLALQILSTKPLVLEDELATIPTLMRLIREGVDPANISIESLHPIEWAAKVNPELLAEIVTNCTAILPPLLKSEPLKGYVAKKHEIEKEAVSSAMVLQELVSLGASLEDGKEPLLLEAIQNDDVELATALLDHGADPMASYHGTPLLHLACSQPNFTKVAKLLLSRQSTSWPLDSLITILKKIEVQNPTVELLAQVMQRYSVEELTGSDAQELLYQLVRLKAWVALDRAIERGLSLYRSKADLTSIFSCDFIANNQETIVHLLAKHHLDPNAKSADGTSFILISFLAIRQATLLSEELMKWQRNVDFRTVTKDQETLIHICVKNNFSNSDSLIPFLKARGVDINALDIHKRPALYYALEPVKPELLDILIPNGATPFFLADRFLTYVDYVTNARKGLIQAQDALELVFLNPTLLHTITGSKEEWLDVLLALHRKYPQAPVEYFYRFLLFLDPAHLDRRVLDFAIPPLSKTVYTSKLLTEFDNLNWQNPNAANYCNSQSLCFSQLYYTKETLRTALRVLLYDRIPPRFLFTGTPPQENERERFYANLEVLLCHIILLLEAEQDQAVRTKYILKLAWSATLCGTRWEETALRIYQKLKYKKSRVHLLEDKFDKSLASLRERLVSGMTKGNIHEHRYYLKTIGNAYRIPLAEGVPNVGETHQPEKLTPQICQRNFRYHYSPELIVPHIKKIFEENIFKNDFILIRWFRDNVPEDYSFPGYQETCWSIKAFELFYKDPQHRRAAVQHLFKKLGQLIPSNYPSEEQLLKDYKTDEYIDRQVCDATSVKVYDECVVDFLVARGVLQETHRGIFRDFIKRWYNK